MDFAALMAKEISKSKAQPPKTAAEPAPTKKFMKRSDVEAERQATYLAEQRAIEAARESKRAEKRKREDDEADANRAREEKRRKLAEESRIRREIREAEEDRARRKRLGLPELVKASSEEVEVDDIGDEVLVERLREMGQPVTLFGESHRLRLRRYRKLGVVMTKSVIPTSLELVEEKEMKVEAVPKDEEGRKFLFRQLASYFTMVLTEWEEALVQEKRDTFASKAAYNAMVSSKENMTPVSLPTSKIRIELTPLSFSANSRKEMSRMGSWNQSSKSSKQHKNGAMLMQMMATCVLVLVRLLGLLELPWLVSTNVVRERSCTSRTRAMSWEMRLPGSFCRASRGV